MNEKPEQSEQDEAGERDLAYEFVIGVLPEQERLEVQRQRMLDAGLDRRIVAWEHRLIGLDQISDAVEPDASTRRALISRLFGPVRGSREEGGLWQSLAFWRSVSVLGTTAMLALSWVLVSGVPQSEGPGAVPGLGQQLAQGIPVMGMPTAQPVKLAFDADYCAWFKDEEGMRWMVWMDSHNGLIQTAALKGYAIPAARDLELWAVPEEGAPRSLGLLPAKGKFQGRLNKQDLGHVKALAVSEEPKGGSPTGAPTGPVRFQSEVWLIGA